MIYSQQLDWYEGDRFRQDQDLIDFIDDYHIQGIRFLGDTEYVQKVVNCQPSMTHDLCVYVVNSRFRFSEIVKICNEELNLLSNRGFLYLALNKFLAEPERHQNIPDSYDAAIHHYLTRSISGSIFRYYSGQEDQGKRFNWAHPLTRFYFRNDHAV